MPEQRAVPRRRRVRIESDGDKYFNTHVYLDGEEIAVTKAVVTVEARHFSKVQLEFYAEVEVDTDGPVVEIKGEPRPLLDA